MTDSKKKETEFEKQVIKDEAEAELAHSKLTKESVQPLNSTEAKNADSVTTSSPAKGIPEPTGKNVSSDNPLSSKTDPSSKKSADKEFTSSFHTKSDSTESLDKQELLKEMGKILEEYGGESNIPITSAYWDLLSQHRLLKSKLKNEELLENKKKEEELLMKGEEK